MPFLSQILRLESTHLILFITLVNASIHPKVIQVIEKLVDVLWVYGSAGAGNLTIAQTIAEMCVKSALTSPSFSSLMHLKHETVKSDLLNHISARNSILATRSYVESTVHIDPAIFDKSLETEVKALITIRSLENALKAIRQLKNNVGALNGSLTCPSPTHPSYCQPSQST